MSVIRTEVRTSLHSHSYGRKGVDFSLTRERSSDGTTFEVCVTITGEDAPGYVTTTLRDLTIEDLQGLREALQLIPLEGSCQ